MDITVNINAPAIVDAINKLVDALGSGLLKTGQLTTAGDASIALTAEPIAIQGALTAPAQPVQAVDSNVTTPAPVVAQSVALPTQTAPVQQTAPAPVQQTAPAPTPVQQTAPAPTPVQQTAPAPVVDEAYRNRVCTGAARLVEQGKMSEVLNILQSFGVPSVVHLTAEQLPEFANQITALGAVI